MQDDEKLKIALDALSQIADHSAADGDDAWRMLDIAQKALRGIQRSHYLVEPSPVVAEKLVGVRL